MSHLLASAKAGDRLLCVTIPPAAQKLRRLMNLGQIIQSHALSFFHLSAPDLLLDMDSDPASRNVFGLIAAQPELARSGNFPSLFMGLVGEDGAWEHYDGKIRFVDSAGNIIADRLDPTRYREFIAEAVEPWSYLKFPYYRPLGYAASGDRPYSSQKSGGNADSLP